MTQTIKSVLLANEWKLRLEKMDDGLVVKIQTNTSHLGITVNADELNAAIAEELGSPNPYLQVIQIDAYLAAHPMAFSKQAREDLRAILNPPPPYEFPTRKGAVIEAEWPDGDGYASYSRLYGDGKSQAVWVRHSNGVATTEYAIDRNAKSIRTIYEGIDE